MDNLSRLSEKAKKFKDEISPVSEILRYADLDYIKSIEKNRIVEVILIANKTKNIIL